MTAVACKGKRIVDILAVRKPLLRVGRITNDVFISGTCGGLTLLTIDCRDRDRCTIRACTAAILITNERLRASGIADPAFAHRQILTSI